MSVRDFPSRVQIMTIRDSGACNMFDLPRVQEEAYKMGFYELVVFLNEHRKNMLSLS